MSRHRVGSEAEIPVLPLVDILFSAFAAILATATVVVAMMRAREPDRELPAMPLFTLAVSLEAGCDPKRLDPGFTVTDDSGNVVRYSLATMANLALDSANDKLGIKAWYMADTADASLENYCEGLGFCARAELVILRAQPKRYSIRPSVGPQSCADARVVLQLGVVDDGDLGKLEFKPAEGQSITIEVSGR